MNCKAVAEENTIERYAAGQLSEADTEAFERHFFECEECYEALRNHAAVRAALASVPREAPSRPTSSNDFNRWWLLAAAMLVLGLGLVLWLAPWSGTTSNQALVAASMVEAPPYEPRTLRSGSVEREGELQFKEAMVAYQQGDFAQAIPGLEDAVALDPDLAKAHFYLGACYLLEDRPDRAIDSLSRVAETDDPIYREWGHFYRAKAHLRRGDIESARRDLYQVLVMEGDLQTQAQEVLERFPD